MRDFTIKTHLGLAILIGSVILGAGTVAPVQANSGSFSGFIETSWTVPTETDNDSSLSIEFNVLYSHDSGLYLGGSLITHDFIANKESFSDDASIEINPGFAWQASQAVKLDIGMSYEQAFDTDVAAHQEVYLGSLFTFYESLKLKTYVYKIIDGDSYMKATLTQTVSDSVAVYGLLKLEFQDSDGKSLELGAAKSLFENQSISGALIADLDDIADSKLEFIYTINF